MAKTKTLVDLSPGESATILRLAGEASDNQRLMHMGIIDGVSVEFVRQAPSGDPIEITVMDYALSLRRDDAARIIIEEPTD